MKSKGLNFGAEAPGQKRVIEKLMHILSPNTLDFIADKCTYQFYRKLYYLRNVSNYDHIKNDHNYLK